MAIKSLKSKVPKIWVPPIYTANFRATVTRSDSTVDDITDILLNLRIEDGVTDGIGNFEFEIPNTNETYTTAWTGMEIFRFYCDYASGTASTLRFRGRIEKPSNENNNVRCTGRSESLFVQGQNVTEDYSAKDAGYIIKDLFDTYGESRFDTSGINTAIGVSLTLTFTDLPFWDTIEAVCIAAGYDCYIDCNLVVQFFEQGTQVNTDEAIVHDYNLLRVGDFAPDLSQVNNKVRVLGGVIDGVQVIYTANNLTSQTNNGIRRKTVNDDGILTIDAAKDLGDLILNDEQAAPIIGEVQGLMLATIQPGDSIRISSPLENIPPTDYRTILYRHNLSEEGLTTTVVLNKQARRLSNVLKARIQREHLTSRVTSNPEDLDFSDIDRFDTSSGTHSDTQVSGGVLLLDPGKTSGSWTSATITTADLNKVDKMRVSLIGDKLPYVHIEVSADNGLSYVSVVRDSLQPMTVTTKSMKVRLSLSDEAAQVDSVQIQYSTTS